MNYIKTYLPYVVTTVVAVVLVMVASAQLEKYKMKKAAQTETTS